MNLTIFIAVFSILPFLLFWLQFARVRWWQSPGGISAFVMSSSILVALVMVLLNRLDKLPPLPAREFVYTLMGVAGWVQLITFRYAQTHGEPVVPEPSEVQ